MRQPRLQNDGRQRTAAMRRDRSASTFVRHVPPPPALAVVAAVATDRRDCPPTLSSPLLCPAAAAAAAAEAADTVEPARVLRAENELLLCARRAAAAEGVTARGRPADADRAVLTDVGV
jgi:hypothetical protein